MKIKIKKASKPEYWYAQCVGESFEVLSEADGCYCVGVNNSLLVGKNDCLVTVN